MEDSDDLLDSLLAAADAQLDELSKQTPILSAPPIETNSCKTLKDADIFGFESNLKLQPKSAKDTFESAVHGGDTDSSDDEGNRNYEDQKYNECGRQMKGLLRPSDSDHSTSSNLSGGPKKRISNWTTRPSTVARHKPAIATTKTAASTKSEHRDVYMDPIFHMRIINPKISSSLLQERMQGRVAVRFADLSRQILAGNLKGKDWVLCGVLVHKSPPKTSQKGSQYSIWTVTDLKDDIKTVGLFMFNSAHSELWKTLVGTVVGVLNPTVMERRDNSKDVACLSIDTSQKVMIFGDSKDFGMCKSTKKSGEKCTSVVNLSDSEFCIYHIKQEYQKCSKRSELQANFAGNGLINLRNKVLGKNEVFYAGKSYMAIPAKKSKKLVTRDNNILQNLNGTSTTGAKYKTAKPKVKGAARRLDVNPAERARDLELLKKLGGSSLEAKTNFCGIRSDDISMETSKATALNVISKLKAKNKEVASVNTVTTKNGQYDLKGDLYVNVDNKRSFSGKASNQVSLEDSKKAALSVISKLKGKNGDPPSANQLEAGESQITLEEFEAELDYSDNEDIGATEKVNSVEEVQEPTKTKSETVQKSSIQSPSSRGSKSSSTSMHVQAKNSSHLSSPKGNSSSKFPLVDKSPIVTPKKSFTVGSALDSMTMGVPMLSGPARGDFIDLSKPITSRHVDRAKLNALKFIQRNGPIKKIDPNNTKTTGSLKRSIENVLVDPQKQHAAKRSKLQESEFISDRFKKMMAMTSKHADLLDIRDDEEKEKYFNKLEIKEKMEDKMANTHKVKCKAVKCLKCKYTSFSASDLCKSEHHPLKVFDAMKRFYQCGNCKNRTVTLELVPTKPCNNCGSSKWEKTGMMKEKIAVVQHNLSIRGGEQKFLNSVVADANVNLMVPDDGA
uniref:Protein MCM10 homolog n=1 Tax=Dendroctonus ponderosae TaxID=77166 RepID=A0AAR5Q633_DENPD